MGYYVHLHVVFHCDLNDEVAALARKHLEIGTVSETEEHGKREAYWYLEELSKRTGQNPGQKGGLSLWGIIGNYTNVEAFIEVLNPFWLDLLSCALEGGPSDYDVVTIFYQPEQTSTANVFVIRLAESRRALKMFPELKQSLRVAHHEDLPFSWMGDG